MDSYRHCAQPGCEASSALMMHKLDGYHSAHDRIEWLCPAHWAEKQLTLVSPYDQADGPNDELSDLESVA